MPCGFSFFSALAAWWRCLLPPSWAIVDESCRESSMSQVLFLLIGVVGFAAMIAYVKLCERL
jgi:hypothetical protein